MAMSKKQKKDKNTLIKDNKKQNLTRSHSVTILNLINEYDLFSLIFFLIYLLNLIILANKTGIMPATERANFTFLWDKIKIN